MTPEEVLQLVAMGWALLFQYLPYLKDKFDALSQGTKVLIQLGAIALVVFGAYGLSCLGILAYFACGAEWSAGLLAAAVLFFKAVIANQGMYQFTRLIGKARGAE